MKQDKVLSDAAASVVGKPMLQTGDGCNTAIIAKPRSVGINTNPNAHGCVRKVDSLKSVEQWGWDAADSIAKNFPPSGPAKRS